MLTAAHGDSVERDAEQAGADLFLTKPFSPLDLLRLVDQLGERQAADRAGCQTPVAMTRRAWLAFAVASVIWGVPYLFIKIAVRPRRDRRRCSPGAGSRSARSCCWRWPGAPGRCASLHGRWRWLLAFAVAEIAIPFPMLAFGEERVPSSLAAIMVATVPLIGAAPGDALRPLRATHAGPRARAADRLLRGDRAGRHRRGRPPRRVARHRGDHADRHRLRDRPDADQAPPRRCSTPAPAMGASLAIAAVLLLPVAAARPAARTCPARARSAR